jgi:hypothetical protein
MRTVLYCASMIAVTSCVSANARPHMARSYVSAPPSVVCSDRGCASTAAASPSMRGAAIRRVRIGRRGSLHAYTRTSTRTYARRRVLEASPRQARVEEPSWSRRAVERPRHHAGGGVVTVQTAAGPITVASGIADQMRALIADLVAHGYRGHVTCLASGHMPHSLHHTGEACDFAQLSRNRVAAGAGIMYHAHAIIAAHGLRDGCSFHDCGHVDSGRMSFHARAQYIPGGMAHIRRYARRYYGHRFYRTAERRYSR